MHFHFCAHNLRIFYPLKETIKDFAGIFRPVLCFSNLCYQLELQSHEIRLFKVHFGKVKPEVGKQWKHLIPQTFYLRAIICETFVLL